MLYGTIIVTHVIVCIALIIIVLIQAGRGGGLAESFSSAESIFGTKTNAFLTRATSVLAVVFFITCLSLALISRQRSKSLLEGKSITRQTPADSGQAAPKKQEAAVPQADAQTVQPVPQTGQGAVQTTPTPQPSGEPAK